ncbi:MAG: hypothetical protein BVN35_06015 [Proteobacteria bacterium ST_bin11]|nr:MAG: hypothetical protein BVN35_06015 [Proteobacteria bacterium ST_bin11]
MSNHWEKDDSYFMRNIKKYGKEPVDVFLSQENISLPTSENQVFTVYFNTQLVLSSIVGFVGTLSYRAKRLTAITFRFVSSYPGRAPSMQLFASGMGVEIGASEINSGKLYVHCVREFLEHLDLPKPPRNGRLFSQNKVSSGLHNYCLDLKKFEANNPLGYVKCNDAFPGTVIQVKPPGCKQALCVSLFHTGKINIMGAYAEQAKRCYMYISNVLRNNRGKRNLRSTMQQEYVALQRLFNLNPPTRETLRSSIHDVIAQVKIEEEIVDDKEEHRIVAEHLKKVEAQRKREGGYRYVIPLVTYELIYGTQETGIVTMSEYDILLHGTKVNEPSKLDEDDRLGDRSDDEDEDNAEEEEEDNENNDDNVNEVKGGAATSKKPRRKTADVATRKKPAPKRTTKKVTPAKKRARTQTSVKK